MMRRSAKSIELTVESVDVTLHPATIETMSNKLTQPVDWQELKETHGER